MSASTRPAPWSRRRRRRLAISAVVLVALVAAAIGGTWWWRDRQHNIEQAELRTAASAALTAWEPTALALLPVPPVSLAGAVAVPGAEGVAAVRAECERITAVAGTVAAATPPAVVDPLIETDHEDAAPILARREALAGALTLYQDGTAAAAGATGDFCRTYPGLVEVTQAEVGALATFDALLGECPLDANGCLPLDQTTWTSIADAVGPAFVEPAQRRAELYGSGCPTPELAGVCTLLGEQNTALVGLYTGYADAMRAGDRAAVETARTTLATTLGEQQVALAAAVTAVVPEATDLDATLAGAFAARSAVLDAAFTVLEPPFLAVIG